MLCLSSSLKTDEHLLFIPSFAYEKENKLIVHVNAWIYEKKRWPGFTSALLSYLDVDKNRLSGEDRARLYARTQLFQVDSERNKQIMITFNNSPKLPLPSTGRDGRTHQTFIFEDKKNLQKNRVPFQWVAENNRDNIASFAYYISQEGISIITDIDDTIKDSNVLDKKALLRNTFLHPFKPALNMNFWYQHLFKINPDISFHYLSASPIQLYLPLQNFLNETAFPPGPLHLREGTAWNRVLAGKKTTRTHKFQTIATLITAFPKRKFILIGDSGEQDPEIYAYFARNYPQQIMAIAIRNTTAEAATAQRFQALFQDIDQARWRIFTDPLSLNDWPFIPEPH